MVDSSSDLRIHRIRHQGDSLVYMGLNIKWKSNFFRAKNLSVNTWRSDQTSVLLSVFQAHLFGSFLIWHTMSWNHFRSRILIFFPSSLSGYFSYLFYAGLNYVEDEYIAHQIQQPIPKLQILNFPVSIFLVKTTIAYKQITCCR